ncbi:MAG: hypothetical protein LH485_06400, partial [Sphingomonas bacterium]|nr:hypothetical protein [Sphingomonas bacterium]
MKEPSQRLAERARWQAKSYFESLFANADKCLPQTALAKDSDTPRRRRSEAQPLQREGAEDNAKIVHYKSCSYAQTTTCC